jgi:protein-S-isoprenylcysteine O-methyltransferase Ste14
MSAGSPRYHDVSIVPVIDYVIYSLWAAFWVAWLIAATTARTASPSKFGPFLGLRFAVFLVACLTVRLGVLKSSFAVVTNPVLQGIGFALFVMGLSLAVWARVCLGRNWGMPMSEKVDAELVTTGPYRFIRNPIYSGIILAAVGTTVAVSWFWLLVVVLPGAYFVYSAVVEERTMLRLFPSSYPQYRRSTKMLIPFIF